MEKSSRMPLPLEIDFLESHDEASIVGELQRIATKLGKRTVTTKEIDKHGLLSSRTVMQKFGTMRKAHEAAGLVASRYTKATDEELFKVIEDLWNRTLQDSGRRPRESEVRKYGCPVSARTIQVRFGSWKKALAATARARARAGDARQAEPVEVVKPRQSLSVRKRFIVLKRDRYRCRICRKSGVELEVDHVIPVSRGGPDRLDNLQTLCKECNRSKRDKLM